MAPKVLQPGKQRMLGHPLEQFSAAVEKLEGRQPQPMSPPERRRRTRAHVHWPVCFFGVDSGETIETVTENLSSSGFQCFSPVPLIPSDLMTCVLRVPLHQPPNNGRVLSLECKVRVVRVESAEERQSFAIACQIEDYRFIESNPLFASALGKTDPFPLA